MDTSITAPALDWRTREFFQAMPGGEALLSRIEDDRVILIDGEDIDHPFFDIVTEQWHVEWDEHRSHFAALVPFTVAELINWFSTVEERDWSPPRRCAVPEWASSDMLTYAKLVAESGEHGHFWKILEKVSWETRYGLTPETAFSVLKLACRLFDDFVAEDEDEAVEAAIEALTK
jgi:hypothetical protein